MPVDQCLCIFARTPVLGQVKRRLAPELGDAGALMAHEELLQGVLDRCAGGADYRTELWLTSLSAPWSSSLKRDDLVMKEQPDGDLGARMQFVLEEGLETGASIVLIGSDCPDIDRDYIVAAFRSLEGFPVVLGPAEDGGYGLVGLNRSVPELFEDMTWGDEKVVSRTLTRAAAAGVDVALLPKIYDVDLPRDWQRYRRSNRAPRPVKGNE